MTGMATTGIDMGLNANSLGAIASFQSLMIFWDALIPLVFVSLIAVSIYLAYKLNASPLFIGIAVIMLLVFVIVAIPVANIFDALGDSASFSGYDVSFPIITALLENLPAVVVLLGALLIIALYTKPQSGIGGEF